MSKKEPQITYTLSTIAINLNLVKKNQPYPFIPTVRTFNKLSTAQLFAESEISRIYNRYGENNIRKIEQSGDQYGDMKHNYVLYVNTDVGKSQIMFQIWKTPIFKKKDVEEFEKKEDQRNDPKQSI